MFCLKIKLFIKYIFVYINILGKKLILYENILVFVYRVYSLYGLKGLKFKM